MRRRLPSLLFVAASTLAASCAGPSEAPTAPTRDPGPAATVRARVADTDRRAALTLDVDELRLTVQLPEEAARRRGQAFWARVDLEGDLDLPEATQLLLELGDEPGPLERSGGAASWVRGRWPTDPHAPLPIAVVAVPPAEPPQPLLTTAFEVRPGRAASLASDRLVLPALAELGVDPSSNDVRRWRRAWGVTRRDIVRPSGVAQPGDVIAVPCPGVQDFDNGVVSAIVAGEPADPVSTTESEVYVALPEDLPATAAAEVQVVRMVPDRDGDGVVDPADCNGRISVVSILAQAVVEPTSIPDLVIEASGLVDGYTVSVDSDGVSCVQWDPDEGADGAVAAGTVRIAGEAVDTCEAAVTVGVGPAEPLVLAGDVALDVPADTQVTTGGAPQCPASPASTSIGWHDQAWDAFPFHEVLVDREREYDIVANPEPCAATLVGHEPPEDPVGHVVILEDQPDPRGTGEETPSYIVEIVFASYIDQCVLVNALTLYTDAHSTQASGKIEDVQDAVRRIYEKAGAALAVGILFERFGQALRDRGASSFQIAAILQAIVLKGFDEVADDPDYQQLLKWLREIDPDAVAEFEQDLADDAEADVGALERSPLTEVDVGAFSHFYSVCGQYVECVGCILQGESRHFVHRPEDDHRLLSEWWLGDQAGSVEDVGPDYSEPEASTSTPTE